MHGNELAKRLTVTDLVAAYEAAERDIRESFDRIEAATERLNTAFCLSGSGLIQVTDRHGRVNFERPVQTLEHVRRQLWRQLVERLELRRMMSVKAWEQLQRQINDGECPPIDLETVTGMVQQFQRQLPSMLEDAICEVFEWLRPRGSQYKSNSEYEVPRKVVLGYVVERDWATHWHVNYHYEANLTALENVFSALDGKGQITKSHYSAISTAIKEIPKTEPCIGETPYFRFKGFKNRNMHLEFKREDLLARFNQIAGGARLKGKAA